MNAAIISVLQIRPDGLSEQEIGADGLLMDKILNDYNNHEFKFEGRYFKLYYKGVEKSSEIDEKWRNQWVSTLFEKSPCDLDKVEPQGSAYLFEVDKEEGCLISPEPENRWLHWDSIILSKFAKECTYCCHTVQPNESEDSESEDAVYRNFTDSLRAQGALNEESANDSEEYKKKENNVD